MDFSQHLNAEVLNKEDISLLNQFFNSSEVTTQLNIIEEKRKKLWREIYWAMPLIIIGSIILIALLGVSQLTLGIGVVGVVLYISYVKKRFNGGISIKNSILPLFVKKIDPDIEYSPDKKHFAESVAELYKKIGLLNGYTSVSKEEDSIKYCLGYSSTSQKEHSIEMTGFELMTMRRTRDSKGRSHETVSNHCYIVKLLFLEPRFTLKSSVKIKGDIYNNSVFGWLIRLFGSKKRVTMENYNFEKKFDVFSEDPVESRMFVTPAFMERLLDFSKKTKKKYSFFFQGNEVYIKSQLWGSFMEFSFNKNVFENTADYVSFYTEIKYIKSLVHDLGLFYYDKGTFSKEQIQSTVHGV